MSEVIEIVAYHPDWPRLFEDENGSEWSSFRLGTGVLLSCGKLHNFPLRSKLQPKIIDSTKQFEYTHGVNPKILSFFRFPGAFVSDNLALLA